MTGHIDSNNVIPLIRPSEHQDTEVLATIPTDNRTEQQR